MADIPLGRITFSLGGHRYEMTAPDLVIEHSAIAAAEARGAALAVEQVRGLIGGLHVDPPNNLTPGEQRNLQEARNLGWNLALVQAEKSLPVSPDTAAEVQRIEERGAAALVRVVAERDALVAQVLERRAAHEADNARLVQERDEARLQHRCSEGTLAMAVARLGGLVEGHPTHRINFLQRIDELVAQESGHDPRLTVVRELEAEAARRSGPEARLILELAEHVRTGVWE